MHDRRQLHSESRMHDLPLHQGTNISHELSDKAANPQEA
jgi:hypothetical protein